MSLECESAHDTAADDTASRCKRQRRDKRERERSARQERAKIVAWSTWKQDGQSLLRVNILLIGKTVMEVASSMGLVLCSQQMLKPEQCVGKRRPLLNIIWVSEW